MSIYPEKRNGVPTGRLRVEVQRNKKTIVRFATSRKEAARLEMEIKTGLHDNPSVASSHSTNGMKVLRDQIDSLWETTKNHCQSTQRAHTFLDLLEKVLKDTGTPDDLGAIKTTHITKTLEKLSDQGLKPATVNRYISAGSKLFKWALDEELIDAMPKFRWRNEGTKATFVLNEEDERRIKELLIQRGHEDAVTIMEVQMASGTRISEVLERSHNDLSNDGDGFYSLFLGITKNGSERFAVLPEDLGKRFEVLLRQGLPSYTSVSRRIKSARKALGLPLTQPTHAHRHTVATRLAKQGVNALVLKDFMGHSNLATTMRYVHNDTASKKQVAKRLMGKPE